MKENHQFIAKVGLAIFIVLACCWLFNYCHATKPIPSSQIENQVKEKKTESDSIKELIKTANIETVKADTGQKKASKKYHKKKAIALKDTTHSPEAKEAVKEAYINCDSARVADSLLTARLRAERDFYKQKHTVDSSTISNLDLILQGKNKAIADTVKHFRRKKIGSFLKGFGAGFATGVTVRELTSK